MKDDQLGLRLAEKVLELQPDFLFGLWALGLIQGSMGRHEEAIATLEKVLSLSRAPFFVSMLASTYGQAGRADDARKLLRELKERQERGEYVSGSCWVGTMIALGDLPGLRTAMEEALADHTPAFNLRLGTQKTLDHFRSDPDIDRLLKQFVAN